MVRCNGVCCGTPLVSGMSVIRIWNRHLGPTVRREENSAARGLLLGLHNYTDYLSIIK